MALAIMYLYANHLHSYPNGEYFNAVNNKDLYQPDGIAALISPTYPSTQLYDFFLNIAHFSPLLLLFGIFSRITSVIVLISNLYISSLNWSFMPGWGHGENIYFLTHIAFLFAPIGKQLSVDCLIRKYIFKKEIDVRNDNTNYWSIKLAQFMVASIFFNAFFFKVLATPRHLTFEWAMGDNMRNILMLNYYWAGASMPDYIYYIAKTPWLYKSIGWGNLLAQALTITPIFFTKSPRLRLFLCLFFVLELVGLDIMMGMPSYEWLLVILFFVDWDYFFRKKNYLQEIQVAPAQIKFMKANYYIIPLVFFHVFVAFGFLKLTTNKAAYQLNVYPFSEFAMYSANLGTKNNIPYTTVGCLYELNTINDSITKNKVQKIILSNYYNTFSYNDSLSIHGLLSNIYRRTKAKQFVAPLNDSLLHEVIFYRVYYEFVPYPALPQLKVKYKGLAGKYDINGVFKTVVGDILECSTDTTPNNLKYCLKFNYYGYTPSKIDIQYSADKTGKEHRFKRGVLKKNEYYFSVPYDAPYNIFITITDSIGNKDKYLLVDKKLKMN